jgi:hypothetical protein
LHAFLSEANRWSAIPSDFDTTSLIPAARAAFKSCPSLCIVEHYHCRFRSDDTDLSCGRKSVHHGHLQIQNHYVGVQLFDFFNSYLAIFCLATDPPIRVLLKARPERMADESTIVDDQN